MKNPDRRAIVCAVALLVGGCSATAEPERVPARDADSGTKSRPPRQRRTDLSETFYVEELGEGVWRHVSIKDLPGFGPFPSNGLVVLGTEGLLLIDTPWTPEQARLLLRWTREVLRRDVRDVVITHAHDDRYGGSEELMAAGAVIRAQPLSIERGGTARWSSAALPLEVDVPLTLSGEEVIAFYPGPAHAPDNVVVWLPARKILFGGCMVRSASDRGLGNLADANASSWAHAIRGVIARFPDPQIVVPGHGEPGGRDLLLHTEALVTRSLDRTNAK